jgi:hypothetical protein
MDASSIKDFNKLEEQISQIKDILGNEALYRLLLDTAIMRNHEVIFQTSNPVLHTRKLFDKEYHYRVADWGGGYPRPFWEIA